MLRAFKPYLQPLSFSVLTILLLPTSFAHASQSDIELQRTYFKEARAALKQHDTQAFQALRKKLAAYPLTPYLDIWQARQAIDDKNDYKVEQALNRYHDIPETQSLRIAWVKSLAKRGQWPHVAQQLKLIHKPAQNFPSISMRSAWYNGDKKTSFTLLSKQWRKGKDIHINAIPRLYEAWKEAGLPSHEDTYVRIIALAKHGKWLSIKDLQEKLPKQDTKLLNIWHDTQKEPATGLQALHTKKIKSQLLYAIIKDLLRRLSADDIAASWQQLKSLKPNLTSKQLDYLQRKIALRAAKQHNPESIKWLASLSSQTQNNETRAWHVRMLLWQQKWKQAISTIKTMPKAQQLSSRWLYWHGHALQMLGNHDAAKTLLKQVALGRGYYSFLGADYMGQAYHMGEKPVKISSLNGLEKEPYIQRSYEWLQLKEPNKASQEWNHGLRHASRQTWLQALQLAASWGWYDRTIQAAARIGAYDALALRFPLAYLDDVQGVAKQTGLQSELIWGVMRQESVFNTKAISHAGARGLMQLMPKTASYIAKESGLGNIQKQELFLPATNIQLGSLYLASLLKRFDNQVPLAIAAYNAGPTRVKRWQEQLPLEDINIWVELIPFNETRRYVQQVMAFAKVYRWRLQQQTIGLLANKGTLNPIKKATQ